MAKVVSQPEHPDTRFQAFLDLVEFADYLKGNRATGDPVLDELHSKTIRAMRGCPGLDGVIAVMIERLDDPNRRLQMLSALLKFAGPPLQMGGMSTSTGNRTLDELLGKAAEDARQAADVETVGKHWHLRTG